MKFVKKVKGSDYDFVLQNMLCVLHYIKDFLSANKLCVLYYIKVFLSPNNLIRNKNR